MKEISIGDVARRSGLPASTLRYYEEKGLIRSIGRRGLSRVFREDVLQRLSLIVLGQSAAFSLDEIVGMLGAGDQPVIDPQRLSRKADELDRTIERLSAVRDQLRHAAVCPAPSHLECPSFQALMNKADPKAIRTTSGKTRSGPRGG